SIVGAAVGIAAYAWLRSAADLSPILAQPEDPDSPIIRGFDRRRFLTTAAATVGLAGVSAIFGRYLIRRANASASRAAVRLPAPADRAKALPAGAALDVSGIPPFCPPND